MVRVSFFVPPDALEILAVVLVGCTGSSLREGLETVRGQGLFGTLWRLRRGRT
jgi:hypothetical protein